MRRLWVLSTESLNPFDTIKVAKQLGVRLIGNCVWSSVEADWSLDYPILLFWAGRWRWQEPCRRCLFLFLLFFGNGRLHSEHCVFCFFCLFSPYTGLLQYVQSSNTEHPRASSRFLTLNGFASSCIENLTFMQKCRCSAAPSRLVSKKHPLKTVRKVPSVTGTFGVHDP